MFSKNFFKTVLFITIFLLNFSAYGDEQNQKKEALKLAKTGVFLFKQKNFSDALDLFLKSDRLFRMPPTVWNIAVCYEKLGDFDNALKWMKIFLEIEKDKEKLEIARKKIKEYKEKASPVVKFEIFPDGAVVFVDGKKIGIAPISPLKLTKGHHEIKIEKQGYISQQLSVDLKPGDNLSIKIKLQQKNGTLSVFSDKKVLTPVKIIVDKKVFKSSKFPFTTSLKPGSYFVMVQDKKGKSIYKSSVVIKPGAVTNVNLDSLKITSQNFSKKKSVYFFIGGGVSIAAGVALHVWSILQWNTVKNAEKNEIGLISGISRKDAVSIEKSAKFKFYSAMAFYGIGIASEIFGFYLYKKENTKISAYPIKNGLVLKYKVSF